MSTLNPSAPTPRMIFGDRMKIRISDKVDGGPRGSAYAKWKEDPEAFNAVYPLWKSYNSMLSVGDVYVSLVRSPDFDDLYFISDVAIITIEDRIKHGVAYEKMTLNGYEDVIGRPIMTDAFRKPCRTPANCRTVFRMNEPGIADSLAFAD